jgi:CRISPR system Cascade subunit CasA
MYNLMSERWIPVRRKDGTEILIRPAEIVSAHDTNPVVALATVRPDFNAALLQFLIGLVQTTYAPTTDDWFERYDEPPTEEELGQAFDAVAFAFELDGSGPRFLQDLDELEGDDLGIDRLLIEMPGEQTLKRNTDLFQKRARVGRLCRPCTATALFTLQSFAPSGGRGHRTSLRGGGPLTTLVMGDTLWRSVWLNVLEPSAFGHPLTDRDRGQAAVFPWCGPTRTSKKGEITAPADVHPLQVYWGMPRRIRLLAERRDGAVCDLCGAGADEGFSQYRTRDSGVNYKGGWCHPLTPHTVDKKTGEPLPRHGSAGGLSYRYWTGLVQNDPDRGMPARVVDHFRRRRHRDLPEVRLRLHASGYDMDNMKACGWYEAEMPLVYVEEEHRAAWELAARQLVRVAEQVVYSLRSAVRQALFNKPKDVPLDRSFFSTIDSRFWQETEETFLQTLAALAEGLRAGTDPTETKLAWLAELRRKAEQLFDEYSQARQIGAADPKRIVIALRGLRIFTALSNQKIREALGLEPAEKETTAKKKRGAPRKDDRA